MSKIVFVFGTRPECIKLAPVIARCKKAGTHHVKVWVTGQHKQMLTQTLEVFDIIPDRNLDLMTEAQTLASFLAKAIHGLDAEIKEEKQDAVVVQGDTSTVLAASLVSFYHRIPLFHVEAGLRTHHKFSPFPEEMNRLLTSRIADFHFAPTEQAKANLVNEGIPSSIISVTGNTSIDALLLTVEKNREKNISEKLIASITGNYDGLKKLILITIHRRENFGVGLENICKALKQLAITHPEMNFIFPVHLNPNVQQPVTAILGEVKNVFLISPLSYEKFCCLMDESFIILTDSGGVQEEAPSLGKPILVLRDNTERPEGINAGCAKLVGSDPERIIATVNELLSDQNLYDQMSRVSNPYGDGKASDRIISLMDQYLQKDEIR